PETRRAGADPPIQPPPPPGHGPGCGLRPPTESCRPLSPERPAPSTWNLCRDLHRRDGANSLGTSPHGHNPTLLDTGLFSTADPLPTRPAAHGSARRASTNGSTAGRTVRERA